MSKIFDGYGNGVDVSAVPATPVKITLSPEMWNNGTVCVATVKGVTSDKTVYVSPAVESISDYTTHGIDGSAQSEDTLTFVAISTPAKAIYVNVMYF